MKQVFPKLIKPENMKKCRNLHVINEIRNQKFLPLDATFCHDYFILYEIHLSLETDDKSDDQTLVSFKNRQFQGNLVQCSHAAEK